MRIAKDSLSTALTELKRALPPDDVGDPGAWAHRVEQALSRLEQAVCREDATLETPDGNLLDIDGGQISSPGVDREVGRLHDELGTLFSEARELRRCLHQARDDTSFNGPAPEPWSGFRQRVTALVQALERCQHEENHLILETVNTDIGGGD
jgi:hypothetical protein